ncbi:MAG: hypothetical protein IJP13_01105 [Lachnospiraceae bacterium]|nr:hypothetical protein [Lachnospiraceae bacterium]
MENVNKLMIIGMGVILFTASIALTVLMYENVSELIYQAECRVSFRKVLGAS